MLFLDRKQFQPFQQTQGQKKIYFTPKNEKIENEKIKEMAQ